jgi:micrococcal nuclease
MLTRGWVWRLVAAGAAVLLLAGCTGSISPTSAGGGPPRRTGAHSATPAHSHTPRPTPSGQHRPHRHDALRPKGPTSRGWRVYDVVDGDTVKVSKGHRDLTLRLIGMDTPEVVDPYAPVQCFGPQASANAHRRLDGRRVVLEFDPSQGRLDKYGRTLAYLWVRRDAGLWLYNRSAIQQGYAKEYTYDQPYAWRTSFVRAQRFAQRHRRGLWSARTCDGDTTQPAAAGSGTSAAPGKCAPGYSPCLPVVADLDCADIGHRVTVTGADQYHLDGDHDGVACE